MLVLLVYLPETTHIYTIAAAAAVLCIAQCNTKSFTISQKKPTIYKRNFVHVCTLLCAVCTS